MRNYLTLFCFFSTCIFITGCKPEKKEANQNFKAIKENIIVYGSKECLHCAVFTRSLDSAGIEYRFCEVDKDKLLFNEMYQKIQKIKYQGYVEYPVVDVNGRVLVNPEFTEIAALLN